MLVNLEFRLLGARSVRSHFSARRFRTLAVWAGAILVGLAVQSAQAAQIDYGDFTAATVDYLDVVEDSVTDPTPLFGQPAVVGDSLDFDPVGFGATATGALGIDGTDGNIKFGIMAHANHGISSVKLSEAGDVTLFGFGTDFTYASVTGTGLLQITHVDGNSLLSPINVPIMMTFTPSGGTYGLLSDGGGGPNYHAFWSGYDYLDLDQALIDNGITNFVRGATKVSIDMDNTLTAASEANTFALIAKKEFGGLSVTVNIPEPAACLLAGIGLLAVVANRRRAR